MYAICLCRGTPTCARVLPPARTGVTQWPMDRSASSLVVRSRGLVEKPFVPALVRMDALLLQRTAVHRRMSVYGSTVVSVRYVYGMTAPTVCGCVKDRVRRLPVRSAGETRRVVRESSHNLPV